MDTPLNAQGITTLTLDHVVKNKEGRDRYATSRSPAQRRGCRLFMPLNRNRRHRAVGTQRGLHLEGPAGIPTSARG